MNKHELIKEVKEIGIYGLNIFGTVVEGIPTKTTIELIKQLDEPEKVKVPQFVAEHIEWAKKEDFHLLGAMNRENFDKKLEAWFYTDDNMELFARAWLDGYEVEKEKRYTVVMKGTKQPLFYNNLHERLFFSLGELATRFTRKQIEDAGLGEVFNSPLFEVEEVEE
nr:MAG TPA: Protein of unknown function (DUF1642) [Caudoviricetes sp.]